MKRSLVTTLATALCIGQASALLLDFDAGLVTSGSGTPLSTTFTADYAYLETDDQFGSPLPQPSWTAYPGDPAQAANPSTAGYGAAPSGTLALDATPAPVLLEFAAPITLSAFTATLDASTFGDPFSAPIQFFDSADLLVGSIAIDQSVPGFTASLTSTVAGVKKVVLPAGAFYDDISLLEPAPIPEPAATALALCAAGLFVQRRRKG